MGFLSEDLLHFVGRRVLCVADEGRIWFGGFFGRKWN